MIATTTPAPALDFSIVFVVARTDDADGRHTRRRTSETDRNVQRVLNALHALSGLGPSFEAKKERAGAICFQTRDNELCLRCTSPMYWKHHSGCTDAYGVLRFVTHFSRRRFTFEEIMDAANRLFIVIRDASNRGFDARVEFDPVRNTGYEERHELMRRDMEPPAPIPLPPPTPQLEDDDVAAFLTAAATTTTQ